jgi:hypothetical protein
MYVFETTHCVETKQRMRETFTTLRITIIELNYITLLRPYMLPFRFSKFESIAELRTVKKITVAS